MGFGFGIDEFQPCLGYGLTLLSMPPFNFPPPCREIAWMPKCLLMASRIDFVSSGSSAYVWGNDFDAFLTPIMQKAKGMDEATIMEMTAY